MFPHALRTHPRTAARTTAILGALLALGLALPAAAVPIIPPPSAFDGSETLIDFETLPADQEVTTQFANLTFSGGLFADDSAGPGFLGSGVTASNFEGGTLPTFDVIDILFATPISRIRFDAITNAADAIDLVVFSVGGGSTIFNFDTSLTPLSLAIQDLAGITAIQLQVVGPGNHAMAIDNVEWATPEPGTALLVGLGLTGLGLHGRRRSRLSALH